MLDKVFNRRPACHKGTAALFCAPSKAANRQIEVDKIVGVLGQARLASSRIYDYETFASAIPLAEGHQPLARNQFAGAVLAASAGRSDWRAFA